MSRRRQLEPLVPPDPRIAELEQRRLERLRYRAALERIAGAESGIWGRIAHEALATSAPAEVDA